MVTPSTETYTLSLHDALPIWIAENMAASKRNIPHFSYVEECDVTALEELRAQLNSARGDKPKLTMLPLLITAICRDRKSTRLNSSHGYISYAVFCLKKKKRK